MFSIDDYNNLDFFNFGRIGLVDGVFKKLDHAMYDIYYDINKEFNLYQLDKKKSKPSFLRPSFKRALTLLDEERRNKLNNFFTESKNHLVDLEGNDFFNCFLVVSPYSVLPHTHNNVEFEQTYVTTYGIEKTKSYFNYGVENEKFKILNEPFFMRLYGEPVPHSVTSNDSNIKFYFVFEFDRKPIKDYKFNTPYLLKN